MWGRVCGVAGWGTKGVRVGGVRRGRPVGGGCEERVAVAGPVWRGRGSVRCRGSVSLSPSLSPSRAGNLQGGRRCCQQPAMPWVRLLRGQREELLCSRVDLPAAGASAAAPE